MVHRVSEGSLLVPLGINKFLEDWLSTSSFM